MQRIEWVKKLADFIESTLPNICSIDQLSQHIDLSKAHMQRQFKLATGISIGHYIRHRRLSRAAYDIANTDKRIIDIAMDYDFESQEAFGRAFRKFFGITPKNLKSQPSLANTISTLPLTLKYLQLFPEICKRAPQKITIPPLQLHGVMQRYQSYHLGSQDQFQKNIDNMWEKFNQTTIDWPEQTRRYFTVECRNSCSVENGDFTMMAMCTGMKEDSDELISFTLPQREMLSFQLTSNEDVPEFITYLYSVYLPENNLFINQMPTLWESFENGDLHCHLSVATWQTIDPPKALTSLDSTLFRLPKLQGKTEYQQIPFVKQQTLQRLEYLFNYWGERLTKLEFDESNKLGSILLIGDDLKKPFTPEFEFHSHLLQIDKQKKGLQLDAASYLRARLTGTLIEIADAIEYIKYWAIPELPFYLRHGHEIILKVTTLTALRYEVVLLLPVKKR